MPDPISYLTADQLKRLADLFSEFDRIRNKVDGLRGDGVTNGSRSITIAQPGKRPGVPDGLVLVRYKITTVHSGYVGVYEAKRLLDAPNGNVTANLAKTDLGMATADSYDLIVWALGDIKAGSSSMAADDIGVGFAIAGDVNAVKPIVIHVAPEAGSSMPAPTAKYQVYTPIDDTLAPIWTSLRMGP